MKEHVLKHITGTKLTQVISYLLQQFYSRSRTSSYSGGGGLSKEVLDMIKEEVRTVVATKISLMLDAVSGDSQKSLNSSRSESRQGAGGGGGIEQGLKTWIE